MIRFLGLCVLLVSGIMMLGLIALCIYAGYCLFVLGEDLDDEEDLYEKVQER